MSGLKLRAHITIDLDAADYAEAATHQARLEDILRHCRASYDAVDLKLAHRRPRDGARAPARPTRHFTGALNLYDDV